MEAHQPSQRPWVGIIAILLVTCAFTAIQIHHSLLAGRLADPPTWDDVVYLDDGLNRLRQIQTLSFGSFLTELVRNPPHSVYSVLMAALSFRLAGVRDWVPYATNGLWLAALLLSVSSLISRAAVWQRALLVILILTMPLTALLITEYRPDLIWGLTSAMAVFSVLRWRWVGSSRANQFASGLWLAAALICKTSTFPLTLLTVGLAWSLAIVCDRTDRQKEIAFREIQTALCWSALPTLLLAVPYYVIEAKPIFGYIFQVLSGPDRNHWVVQGNWLDRARYFLDRGGRVMMRNHFYLLAVILIGGGLPWIRSCLLFRRHARLRRGCCVGAVTFIAYLEPTVNPAKNPFFGAEFQFLLLLSAVALLDELIGESEKMLRLLGNLLLATTSLTAIACVRFPAPVGAGREPDTARLVQAIISTVQSSSKPEPRVFLAVVGDRLNTSTLNYLSQQSGRHLTFTQPAYNATLAQIVFNLDQYDFIVAGETGAGDLIKPWAPNRFANETLAVIESDLNFGRVLRLQTFTGKRLFIFARRSCLSAAGSSSRRSFGLRGWLEALTPRGPKPGG